MVDQDEINRLLGLKKHSDPKRTYKLPFPGNKLSIQLDSDNRREKFALNVYRGKRIELKFNYSTIAKTILPFCLVRVDLNGSEHQNPDGTIIPCPHIHIFNEEFGESLARPLSGIIMFKDIYDTWEVLQDFISFCNIETRPVIDNQPLNNIL
jgi:MoaA/NifB/PqqE/SkfB family radical SAM enzyme